MRNTYVKCANWTWEEKLLYIKACIGEDIPHSKICGNASYKKSDLLETYKNVAAYIYCYSNGMISFDEERDGVNPSKNHGVEVNLSELKPKQEKPKPTKFVKVEESIFDLKGEFERGELYCKNLCVSDDYTKLNTEVALFGCAAAGNVYRQVEIDWRDEVAEFTGLGKDFYTWVDCINDMYNFDFVEMCHKVAELTDKPE